jgi:hypothetical protein
VCKRVSGGGLLICCFKGLFDDSDPVLVAGSESDLRQQVRGVESRGCSTSVDTLSRLSHQEASPEARCAVARPRLQWRQKPCRHLASVAVCGDHGIEVERTVAPLPVIDADVGRDCAENPQRHCPRRKVEVESRPRRE